MEREFKKLEPKERRNLPSKKRKQSPTKFPLARVREIPKGSQTEERIKRKKGQEKWSKTRRGGESQLNAVTTAPNSRVRRLSCVKQKTATNNKKQCKKGEGDKKKKGVAKTKIGCSGGRRHYRGNFRSKRAEMTTRH